MVSLSNSEGDFLRENHIGTIERVKILLASEKISTML